MPVAGRIRAGRRSVPRIEGSRSDSQGVRPARKAAITAQTASSFPSAASRSISASHVAASNSAYHFRNSGKRILVKHCDDASISCTVLIIGNYILRRRKSKARWRSSLCASFVKIDEVDEIDITGWVISTSSKAYGHSYNPTAFSRGLDSWSITVVNHHTAQCHEDRAGGKANIVHRRQGMPYILWNPSEIRKHSSARIAMWKDIQKTRRGIRGIPNRYRPGWLPATA